MENARRILNENESKRATTVRNGIGTAMFNIFSVHVISLIIAGLSLVAVFIYIPFVSDYAYWFLMAAYIMQAGHRG